MVCHSWRQRRIFASMDGHFQYFHGRRTKPSEDVSWMIRVPFRENVGWASTCNSVGQTAGYFLGNVVFLSLESRDFANRYIRQPLNMELQSTGLITLPGKINVFSPVKSNLLRRFSSLLGCDLRYFHHIGRVIEARK